MKNNIDKESEIDLYKFFHILLNGKRTIILVTLLSVTLAVFLANSRPTLYKSVALVEIGQYYNLKGEKDYIENSNELVSALTIKFNYTDNEDVALYALGKDLIQVETTTFLNQGPPLLKKVVEFIENRHSYVVNKYKSQNLLIQNSKIKELDSTLKFNTELLKLELESNKSKIERDIILLNQRIKEINLTIRPNLISNNEINVASLDNKISLVSSHIAKELETSQMLKDSPGLKKFVKFLEEGDGLEIATISNSLELARLMEIFASIPKTEQATYESKLNLVSLISTRDLAISRLNTEMALLDKEVIDSSIILVTLKDSLSNTKDGLSSLVNNDSTQLYQINLNLDSLSNDQSNVINTLNRADIITKINLNIFKLTREKSSLEYELMLLDIQSEDNTSSSLVGSINTTEIYSKSMIIILLGLIFGLAISVIMVFLSLTFNNIFRSNKA